LDVLIIGAGPAGAALGYLLARSGGSVVLLERELQFSRVFRGEVLMPSGLEALREFGLGQQLDALPSRRFDSWRFHYEGELIFRYDEPVGELNGPRIVSQPALLDMLVGEAKRYPGFRFETGVTARDLTVEAERIVVRADTPSGKAEFSADYLVGADGRNSVVRKRLNLPMAMSPAAYDVVWFVLPLPDDQRDETWFRAYSGSRGTVVAYPSWDDRLRLAWIIPKGAYRQIKEVSPQESLIEIGRFVDAELAQHLERHRAEVGKPLLLDVTVGCCLRWTAPGVLLLGDAAHPMSPLRAQGINLALRDVLSAANHMQPLHTDGKSRDELDRAAEAIQSERLPEIRAIQRLQVQAAQAPSLVRNGFFRRFILPLLNRIGMSQRAWLRTEHQLRQGTYPLRLQLERNVR
jgi:2-polyprenyl-6-methoxyphenol hydroxylase-like FAD-dependent oxidoreductase